jgi:hypothetical protein
MVHGIHSFHYLKGASGMIKFLAESCLSGLGIVLKEPSAFNFIDETPYLSRDLNE